MSTPAPYGPPLRGSTPGDPVAEAADVIELGFVRGRHEPVRLDEPIPWDGRQRRSLAWVLHAWRPIEPLLRAADVDPDPKWLELAARYALEWQREGRHVDAKNAWYDIAVGQRAYRLAHLAAHLAAAGDPRARQFLAMVDEHATVLLDKATYAGHSNHGLFQVAGMLALARSFPERKPCRRAGRVGARRLEALLEDQFASDGIHREHSPGYHATMVRAIIGLVDAQIITDRRVVEQARNSEAALAWFVAPDGKLLQFGDSHDRRLSRAFSGRTVNPEKVTTRWSTPEMRAAASAGQIGVLPDATTRAFFEGGYAVLRTGWPGRSAPDDLALVGLMAAFHSRTHKHADDLSIIWYTSSRPVLVDGGRYGYIGERPPAGSTNEQLGYWYDDPHRMYCESTRAHNTVMIDGANHDRLRAPYGSGIRAVGRVAGLDERRFAIGSVPHGTVIHHRAVVLFDDGSLVVVDALDDTTGRNHVYEQRYLAAPDLEARRDDRHVIMRDADRAIVWASSASPATPADLVRGEVDPLTGWHSPADLELVPAWTFGWAAPRGSSAAFATHFAVRGRSAAPRLQRRGPERLEIGLGTPAGPLDLEVDFAAAAVSALES